METFTVEYDPMKSVLGGSVSESSGKRRSWIWGKHTKSHGVERGRGGRGNYIGFWRGCQEIGGGLVGMWKRWKFFFGKGRLTT